MGENGEFSEADFEACFKEFDKDGNGTISKDEMKIFIKKVAGLWTAFSWKSRLSCQESGAHSWQTMTWIQELSEVIQLRYLKYALFFSTLE